MNDHQAGVLQSRPAAASSPAPDPLRPGVYRVEPDGPDVRRAALVRVPDGLAPGVPVAAAVLLHGSGGEPQQGLSLLEPFASRTGLLVLAPASRDYTWDGILGRMGPDVGEIDHLLRWLFDRFAVDPTRLAIGGFSDGASYALALGLANGNLFPQVAALSPGFIPSAVFQGAPRVYVSHGTRDAVLPIDRCSRRIVPALQRGGLEVEYREFDGGHVIPEPVAQEACGWLLA